MSLTIKIDSLLRELLFFLFALYNSQGWLYPAGSAISKACLIGVILISSGYFLRTLLITGERPMFYTAWTLLLVLNILGFIFSQDLSDERKIFMLKNILGCMLPFYAFYYFTLTNALKSSHLVRLAIIMIPVTIFQFYYYRDVFLAKYLTEESAVVNNIAYSFVGLIPYAFLIKNKNFLSVIFIMVLVFFIIQSAKRGAIISGLAGLILYTYHQLSTINVKNRIIGYLAALSAITVMLAFTYKNLAGNEFLIYRINSVGEGDTSGRNILYSTILNTWYNCGNIFRLIFGFGFASSVKIAGDYAHNDWLELLSNFGLTGIIVYLFFFYSAYRYITANEHESVNKKIMISTISIWFIVSTISMGYTSLNYATFAILLGYITVRKKDLSRQQ